MEPCKSVYHAILRLRGNRHDFPIILVGGGAPLLVPLLENFDLKGYQPEKGAIANAYGAGFAEISSVVDVVVSLKEREKVLNQLKEEAKIEAIKKGAASGQVRIAALSILPFAYTSNGLAKVMITASGPRK